jgi:hypothetical protein
VGEDIYKAWLDNVPSPYRVSSNTFPPFNFLLLLRLLLLVSLVSSLFPLFFLFFFFSFFLFFFFSFLSSLSPLCPSILFPFDLFDYLQLIPPTRLKMKVISPHFQTMP